MTGIFLRGSRHPGLEKAMSLKYSSLVLTSSLTRRRKKYHKHCGSSCWLCMPPLYTNLSACQSKWDPGSRVKCSATNDCQSTCVCLSHFLVAINTTEGSNVYTSVSVGRVCVRRCLYLPVCPVPLSAFMKVEHTRRGSEFLFWIICFAHAMVVRD